MLTFKSLESVSPCPRQNALKVIVTVVIVTVGTCTSVGYILCFPSTCFLLSLRHFPRRVR